MFWLSALFEQVWIRSTKKNNMQRSSWTVLSSGEVLSSAGSLDVHSPSFSWSKFINWNKSPKLSLQLRKATSFKSCKRLSNCKVREIFAKTEHELSRTHPPPSTFASLADSGRYVSWLQAAHVGLGLHCALGITSERLGKVLRICRCNFRGAHGGSSYRLSMFLMRKNEQLFSYCDSQCSLSVCLLMTISKRRQDVPYGSVQVFDQSITKLSGG